MATLTPSLHAAMRMRTQVVASAAGKPNQAASPLGDDIVKGALMSAKAKRPWWAPLFSGVPELKLEDPSPEKPKSAGKRSAFTAEKARLLRKELRVTKTWHDPMYHSAIAARLASPDQNW